MPAVHVLSEVRQGTAVLAALIALVAARLGLKASSQRKDEQEASRDWYDLKWQRISSSRWLELPELVIRWLVARRDQIKNSDLDALAILSNYTCPLALGAVYWLIAENDHHAPSFHYVLITLSFLAFVTS